MLFSQGGFLGATRQILPLYQCSLVAFPSTATGTVPVGNVVGRYRGYCQVLACRPCSLPQVETRQSNSTSSALFFRGALLKGEADTGFWGTHYSTQSLHESILSIVSNYEGGVIGLSNGSTSMFPVTILNPVLTDVFCLEYQLEDGRFHDGRHYYVKIFSEYPGNQRPTHCANGLIPIDIQLSLRTWEPTRTLQLLDEQSVKVCMALTFRMAEFPTF